MKSISFKNFRRFAYFPELKFGDITILVGGNNAGKSTLQKALLLVFETSELSRRNLLLSIFLMTVSTVLSSALTLMRFTI